MPGLNGTGPMGAGSMTGRGMGTCNNNESTLSRFGRGCGRGARAHRRCGFQPAATPPMDRTTQIQQLQQQQEAIQQQIDALGDCS